MSIHTRATIDDLYKVEGKAELVNGEIVEMPPAGDEPSVVGGEIFANLRDYARRTRRGRAYPDGALKGTPRSAIYFSHGKVSIKPKSSTYSTG